MKKNIFSLVARPLLKEYRTDRVVLYAAASSYYAIFSLAPIIVMVSLTYTFVLGKTAANNIIFVTIYRFFGEVGVNFYENATLASSEKAFGLIAGIALVLFIYGVTRLSASVHSAFADIFNFEIEGQSIIRRAVKKQIWSLFYLILLLLFILFLAFGNIAVSLFGPYLANLLFFASAGSGVVIGNFLVTLLCAIIILTFMYRLVSDRRISWRGALVGASGGATLFALVATLFGLYVSHSVIIPLYGAGSFIVALVLWVYYSLQSMFLGAELAKVYECQFPHHRQKVCL